MTKNNFSTKEIYELIDKKIGQVNDSIVRLETKFDTLEQGRLSNLETKVADMQGRMMATTGMIAFIISVAISLAQFLLKND
ncbi:MAG: hypothetical protein AABY22_26235 [Nanoarchaeota archaeon]